MTTLSPNPVESDYMDLLSGLLQKELREQLGRSEPGHCLRAEGLPLEALRSAAEALFKNVGGARVCLLSNSPTLDYEITATKLVELRNQAEASHVLLVLIPSNLRTAAEDSFDKATFLQVPTAHIERAVVSLIEARIPNERRDVYRRIMTFMEWAGVANPAYEHALYLLSVEADGYCDSSWGKHLHYFGFIPDSILLEYQNHLERRLSQNRDAALMLSDVNQPLIARIQGLDIEPDSIQADLYAFLKSRESPERIREWGKLVASAAESQFLDFSKWPLLIVERAPEDLEIYALPLGASASLTIDSEGFKRYVTKRGRAADAKVVFETRPSPMEVDALAYFKIDLMRTLPGGDAERIDTLVKFPKPKGKTPRRNKKVKLDPNQVAEGTYFFRVLGLDQSGLVLNRNDGYRDRALQAEWQKRLDSPPESGVSSREGLHGKLISDTEDFTFRIEDSDEADGDSAAENRAAARERADSLSKALIHAHIEVLQSAKKPDPAGLQVESAGWSDEGKTTGKDCTFDIAFNDVRLNYQVRLPTILRDVSWFILREPSQIGKVRVELTRSPTAKPTPTFVGEGLSSAAPTTFMQARQAVFDAILAQVNGADEKHLGTPESTDYLAVASEIEAYVAAYVDWAQALLDAYRTAPSEQSLLAIRRLQSLDYIELSIPMSNGRPERALVLPPLHPLRLAWGLQFQRVFSAWEKKSLDSSNVKAVWSEEVADLFLNGFRPSNQVLLVHGGGVRSYAYVAELAPGWGFFSPVRPADKPDEAAYGRVLLSLAQEMLGVPVVVRDTASLVPRHLTRQVERYLKQHPYVEALTVNVFNPGNGQQIIATLIELQQQDRYKQLSYEIRIFASDEHVDEAGTALDEFLNPSGTLSSDAETFIVPSKNPLFPKIRFSRRTYSDYLAQPGLYEAHLTLVLEMFPVQAVLFRGEGEGMRSVFCHGLVVEPRIAARCSDSEFSWTQFLSLNRCAGLDDGDALSEVFHRALQFTQQSVAVSLAGKFTDDVPALALSLNDRERALLHQVHEYSDWVITVDRNLGVDVFDTRATSEFIPYLLDYSPGAALGELPLFLTTRPTSEIYGLLQPYMVSFGLLERQDTVRLRQFLEAIRSVSSSMIMQLASNPNRALESLGIGLSRLLLTRLGILTDHFMIPLDVHRDLFAVDDRELDEPFSEQRGDFLLLSVDESTSALFIQVIEVKCRQKTLGGAAFDALRNKMVEQLDQTEKTLRLHFDPDFGRPDRIDRSVKNRQLAEILEFYALRASRYGILSDVALVNFKEFLIRMDEYFSVSFGKMGLVFEFDGESDNLRQLMDTSGVTFFRAGLDTIRSLVQSLTDEGRSLTVTESEEALSPPMRTLRTTIRQSSRLPAKIDSPVRYEREDSKATPSQDSRDGAVAVIGPGDSCSSELRAPPLSKAPDQTPIGPSDEPMILKEAPGYADLIGDTERSRQYGILGSDLTKKKIALDLAGCNTISLFGVPGAGKSYTLGSIVEMAVQPIGGVNLLPRPLAAVIFHFNESQDYPPEFVSMRKANTVESEIRTLREQYGADPQALRDIVLLAPKDKLRERREEYPDIEIIPMAFASSELSIKDWKFLMGALGNQSLYMQQINLIMRKGRDSLTIDFIKQEIENSALSDTQKDYARQRVALAEQFIDDSRSLRSILRPGRLVIVDLRDEFIEKDQALGLFVVMLSIFASAKGPSGTPFNKLIAFDEAHKYITSSDLTGHVVEVIRQMRHQGVTMLIASQDPPSLPNSVIELSSAIVLHRFNSPQWLKHVQKSVIALQNLTASQLAALQPGEAFLWANKATHPDWTKSAIKITTRPRATLHGGSTQKAIEN